MIYDPNKNFFNNDKKIYSCFSKTTGEKQDSARQSRIHDHFIDSDFMLVYASGKWEESLALKRSCVLILVQPLVG